MWEEDWALLGIEPTTELAAIKKAYALKLKVTRPDDDAEAYQALRGAYERVQQWAAWQRAQTQTQTQPAEAPEPALPEVAPAAEMAAPVPVALPTEPAPAPAPMPVPQAPPTPPPDTPLADAMLADAVPPIPAVEPRALTDTLELAWRRADGEGLRQAWLAVRQALDAQPLARQAEFSSAFALWLVNLPQLPDSLAAALNEYFGWQGDFRTERMIGPALAHALQTALAERFPPPVEPGIVAIAEPLLRAQRLIDLGRSGRALWLAFLLEPTLARLQAALGPALLRRLGLDAPAQTVLRQTLQRAFWMRMGVGALLVAAGAWLNSQNGGVAFVQTLYWAVCIGLLTMAGVWVGAVLNTGPTLQTAQRRLALPLSRWRQHRMQPWLGLVWLLFSAGLAAMSAGVAVDERTFGLLAALPPWAWVLGSVAFALAGLTVAWPLEPMHGLVLATMAPLIAYLADAALGAWIPSPSAVLIGWAWMLAGAAVFSQRLPAAGVLPWLVRPITNTLALADRWSLSLALTPLAAALAWMAVHDNAVRPLTMFAFWAGGLLVVSWLQTQMDRAGQRWLPPLPESPQGH